MHCGKSISEKKNNCRNEKKNYLNMAGTAHTYDRFRSMIYTIFKGRT